MQLTKDRSNLVPRNRFAAQQPLPQICLLALCISVICSSSTYAWQAAKEPDSAAKSDAKRSDSETKLQWLDLNEDTKRQIVVDREPGQYLGHPTTVLLDGRQQMICVYPKGHGRGPIVMKRSQDAGITWSERLATPDNWSTSQETPTIYRVQQGDRKGLIVFSGLYPIRAARSWDEGATWTSLEPIGEYGGIVAMSSLVPLSTGPGHYVALFHDDGRFFRNSGKVTGAMTLYQTFTQDAGLTWSEPQEIYSSKEIHLCEPGAIRSPDGKQIAVLLRENRRVQNSHIIFSDDEAKTWTVPRPLPDSLNGDRHVGKYSSDGRLLISFRDLAPAAKKTQHHGDWVAWVGTYQDLLRDQAGQYRVRIKDNLKGTDCAYPGVEILPDDTYVLTTYGHWTAAAEPYILSVQLKLGELDQMAAKAAKSK